MPYMKKRQNSKGINFLPHPVRIAQTWNDIRPVDVKLCEFYVKCTDCSRIQPSSRVKFVGNLIVISSVGVVDNGVYSCRARNRAGSVDSLTGYILNVPGTWRFDREYGQFSSVFLKSRSDVTRAFRAPLRDVIICCWMTDQWRTTQSQKIWRPNDELESSENKVDSFVCVCIAKI